MARRSRWLSFSLILGALVGMAGTGRLAGEELYLLATLDQSQVVRPDAFQPPVFGTGSPGSGLAELRVDPATGDFALDVEIEGVDPAILDSSIGPNLTALHVHRGRPDQRGPVVIDCHYYARQTLPGSNGVTRTETGFRMHAEGTITQVQGKLDIGVTVEEVLEFFRTEEAFVAVHTTSNELFRTGAIRGNFTSVPRTIYASAFLDQSQVVRPEAFQPPQFGTGSPGIAGASFSIDRCTGQYAVDIDVQGVAASVLDNTIGPNLTGVHMHRGPRDARGPIFLDVHHFAREALSGTNGVSPTTLGFRLHAEGVFSQVQGDLDTGLSLADVVDFLLTDQAFVAVHTSENELFRTGAIRGHFSLVAEPPANPFLRSDCDGDGRAAGDVSDPVFFLTFLFAGGPAPPCLAACDADGDGQTLGQVTDAVFALRHRFLGDSPPPPPYPACGPVHLPTDGVLGCDQPSLECTPR